MREQVSPRHPWRKVRDAKGPQLVRFLPGELGETAGDNMKETPQEYIKRITSYVEGQQPLKVQAATPKRLESV